MASKCKNQEDSSREPYINKSGKHVPGRSIGGSCSCKNRRISRMHICSGVYDPRHLDGKDQGTGAEETGVTPVSSAPVPWSNNVFSYFISVGGQEHELCMSAFMSVHSIGKKRLTRLKQSKNHPTPPLDQRGLHGKQPCTPEDLKIKIRQHIRSFPTITSHYSRQINPNKRYLHPN
ncbi:hypothetical protein PoB_001867600 [Plakobranchus ocellatus]|uniref:Uncharacterized protein n=1 Tax=Plakobranchus ocellatus TaxID=259542 RepID=A0AAV3ZC14_9GAST|nr:hypothetical protein PoB_001867600 [Plakobranchus ocellatus]